MASLLRFIPQSSAAVPIDWSKVPEKSKQYFLQYYHDITDEDTASGERFLPQTIGGLAESFHDTKFISYMGPELCQLLLDISEFGLKYEEPENSGLSVGPRFYMKFDREVWFVLFTPGEKGGASGFSGKLPSYPNVDYDNDEDWEAAEAAKAEKDKEVAENFDKKLVDEVSRFGLIGVLSSGKLAGWGAYTMKSSLEVAQLGSAMLSLPQDHPAFVGYMRSFFASLRR